MTQAVRKAAAGVIVTRLAVETEGGNSARKNMDNGDVSVGRGRLQNNMDDCEEEDDDPCHKSGPVTLAQWPRQDGSRLAFGRLKANLFETRLAAHVRRAQLAITDSIKHAGWAVEHKVGVNCGLHCGKHARVPPRSGGCGETYVGQERSEKSETQ